MAHPDVSARLQALEREFAAFKEAPPRRGSDSSRKGTHSRLRWVLAFTGLLAITVTGVATGVTGDTLREGQRNPNSGFASQETLFQGSHGAFTGRFLNNTATGGGLGAGCNSTGAAGSNPCLRSRNVDGGLAFGFYSDGSLGGEINVSGANAKPFTTNAGGVATGLNADKVDGLDASDLQDAPATVGEHWGPIARNTIGSPVEELRNGPYISPPGAGDSPPFGKGSLGLEVQHFDTAGADEREKASFGNEVDFFGDSVNDLDELGFRYYTTGENGDLQGDGRNLPGITIEIDPNLSSTSSGFSSLVWQPGPAPVENRWTGYEDATSSGDFMLTGAAGTATGCTLANPCSFSDMKDALDDGGDPAVIASIAVTKGRDNAWQGAVDGLRVNDDVFDFELFGVRTEAAS